MMATELKRELATAFTDYEFSFNGKHGSICPFNTSEGKFFAGITYDDFQTECDDINELMNLKFLDGKSLNEVAEEIELYG